MNCITPLSMILLAVSATVAVAAAPTKKPNVIFILADDLGWADTATYGSQYYETPNIDKLAAEGLKFTNHHHCQNCQPTRAALMTGQYSPRTGIYTVGGINRFDWKSRPLRPVDNVTALPLDKITIAQALKASGYSTAMFGKWHLGEGQAYHPAQRGFDEAIVSNGRHLDFVTNPKTPYPKGQYLADFLTDRAEGFIRSHKNGPFFLYLPHFGVHSPYQVLKEDEQHFAGKKPVGGHNNSTYAGMIYAVDRSVGRILALLDELKIADDTIVIFASDNGGVGGYNRPGGVIRDPAGKPKKNKPGKDADEDSSGGITDNAPLRSGKGSLYEGGTRVPLIVRWPRVVAPAGTCNVPTIHVDLFPTLLEVTATAVPNQVLDGESLVPLLKDAKSSLKRTAIYQHFPGYLGKGAGAWRTTPVTTIQAGDWKLLEYLEYRSIELYNLKDDIGEKTNLAKTMPEKASELHKMLLAWRTEIKAPMPSANPQPKTN